MKTIKDYIEEIAEILAGLCFERCKECDKREKCWTDPSIALAYS